MTRLSICWRVAMGRTAIYLDPDYLVAGRVAMSGTAVSLSQDYLVAVGWRLEGF